MTNVRALASQALVAILDEQQSLDKVIEPLRAKAPPQSGGFLQELCYGVCRWYSQLDAILQQLLSKPLKPTERNLHFLLLVGLYQLLYLNIPPFVVVNETVHGCQNLKKPWAKGLVNGVLRQFIRNQVPLLARVNADPATRYAHPQWLLDLIRQNWPNQWREIASLNNTYPPLCLRINRQKITKIAYCQLLREQKIPYSECSQLDYALWLPNSIPVAELPLFAEGQVSVQNESAQRIELLLDLKPNLRVLDATAAPGGKTALMLEAEPGLKLTAIDRESFRVNKLRDTLQRLQLSAQVISGDSRATSIWWDKIPYDRILLDAPCSGSGVIRRHPDGKWHKKPESIQQLASMQLQLLQALWPLLTVKGLLLYVTCSLFREENDDVISQWLRNISNATIVEPSIANSLPTLHGRQILPGDSPDGFYYCLIQKKA